MNHSQANTQPELLDLYSFENELAYLKALKAKHPEIGKHYEIRREKVVGGYTAVAIWEYTYGMYRMHPHNYWKYQGWAVRVGDKTVYGDTLKDIKAKIAEYLRA